MYRFSDEHEQIRGLIRRWTQSKLEPRVAELKAGEPPYALMRDFARTFGLADLARGAFARLEARARDDRPEAGGKPSKGGAGLDPALAAIVSLELSRSCPGFALAFAATVALAGGAIMGKGTLEQKRRWALPILSWDKIGAWGMTEPGAGSDAFRAMRTTAVPRDGGYVLNGQKTFITNAPYADIFVIYAKIDRGDDTPLAERPIQPFVVERGDAGLTTSAPMKKMGMHASPTGEVFLADCFVPSDRLLGLEPSTSGGRASGKDVFHSERTGAATMAVGIIERCLEIAVDYAKQRVTWGKPIAEYQLVQDKLARMFVHLENCRNMMFKSLTLAAEGVAMSAAEASAAKLYCARAATEAALDAVQVLGGNGYMREYRVEMFARDAKLLQIGGGTDEIQILHIARGLLAS